MKIYDTNNLIRKVKLTNTHQIIETMTHMGQGNYKLTMMAKPLVHDLGLELV